MPTEKEGILTTIKKYLTNDEIKKFLKDRLYNQKTNFLPSTILFFNTNVEGEYDIDI